MRLHTTSNYITNDEDVGTEPVCFLAERNIETTLKSNHSTKNWSIQLVSLADHDDSKNSYHQLSGGNKNNNTLGFYCDTMTCAGQLVFFYVSGFVTNKLDIPQNQWDKQVLAGGFHYFRVIIDFIGFSCKIQLTPTLIRVSRPRSCFGFCHPKMSDTSLLYILMYMWLQHKLPTLYSSDWAAMFYFLLLLVVYYQSH